MVAGNLWRVTGLLVIAGVIAMLLLSEPRIAWNSGARERLFDALIVIRDNLPVAEKENSTRAVDQLDFAPRKFSQTTKFNDRNSRLLAAEYGVRLKWRRRGYYEELFFYPVVISCELPVVLRPNGNATHLVVQVPLDQQDVEALPILHGCDRNTWEETRQCQLRRMSFLFSKHGIDRAVTLRSDGSVCAVPVDALCNAPH